MNNLIKISHLVKEKYPSCRMGHSGAKQSANMEQFDTCLVYCS